MLRGSKPEGKENVAPKFAAGFYPCRNEKKTRLPDIFCYILISRILFMILPVKKLMFFCDLQFGKTSSLRGTGCLLSNLGSWKKLQTRVVAQKFAITGIDAFFGSKPSDRSLKQLEGLGNNNPSWCIY